MVKRLLLLIFLGSSVLNGLSLNASYYYVSDGGVSEAFEAGRRQKPFNWYYPYPNEYYYPRSGRRHLESYRSSYQGRCYWQYRDGNYIYYCE